MYRYITLYIKYKTLTKFFRHPQRVAASLSIIQLRNSGGLGIWGAINLLEGYGNDNPGANAHVR